MGDDSPVGASSDSTSLGSLNFTDEKSPDSKTNAGMSNELCSMAVTPPKEWSPDTMDKRLVLHCEDIASASVGNPLVNELRGEHIQTPDLSNNSFAKMIDGKQPVSMDGMNIYDRLWESKFKYPTRNMQLETRILT